MDTIFDYIVDAAYKIKEYGEDDLFGATRIEGKSSSFTVIHDLKHAYITNNFGAEINKEIFCKIFVDLLNEKKRMLHNEEAESHRLKYDKKHWNFKTINYK